jgi:hypothetical protein
MVAKLPVPFDGYQVEARYNLDYRAWNATMGDIHRRLQPLEEARDRETELFNRGVTEVLKRVDAAIAPVVEAVRADTEVLADQIEDARGRVEQILAGGIPAANVAESGTRVFVSPVQRDAIDALPAQVAAAIAAAIAISNRFTVRAYHLSGF